MSFALDNREGVSQAAFFLRMMYGKFSKIPPLTISNIQQQLSFQTIIFMLK
jgi:hypothetical protein